MRKGQEEIGAPGIVYRDTKANVEAIAGVIGGETAHATDTGENGYYDEVGAVWVWGSGTGTGTTVQRIVYIPSESGEDGEAGTPGAPGFQGVAGAQGSIGSQGAQGIPGIQGEDGEDGQAIPGPRGETGPAGAQGIPGTTMFIVTPGEDGDDAPIVPGPKGADGTSGGSGNTTEIDFGSSGVTEDVFTVTDATVSPSSIIHAFVVLIAPSDGRDLDEIRSESLECLCLAGSGSFDLEVFSLIGNVTGKFVIGYMVS